MSRVSPYPAAPRSTRPIADYGDPQPTRPLEIGRSARPSTSNGPSRPQRSGLRKRQTSVSSVDSRVTRDSRLDSMSEIYQTPPRSRPRPTMPITASPEEMSPLSTTSPSTSATMNAALSALQSAGQRRRAMTAGSEDVEWERKQTLDQEAERRQLQKRIKDRVPQRRARGKAKAGDIDGMPNGVVAATYDVVFTVRSCPSGVGSNSRRVGVMYITRCKTHYPRREVCRTILKS